MGIYIANAAAVLGIGWMVHKADNKWISHAYILGIWCFWTLLAGFRTGIGTDYNHYYNIFCKAGAAQSLGELFSWREEWLYLLLNKLVFLFSEDFRIFLFLYSAVLYLGFLLLYQRHSRECYLSLWLFVAFEFFAVSLCFMRQAAALLFVMHAFTGLPQGKKIRAVILILLGAGFHISALCALAVLVLGPMKWTRGRIAALVIGALGVLAGMRWFLPVLLRTVLARYQVYEGTPFLEHGHPSLVVFPMLMGAGILYGISRTKQKWREEAHRYMGVIAGLGMIMALYSYQYLILERVTLYFSIYGTLAVPQILKEWKTDGEDDDFYYKTAVGVLLAVSAAAFVFGLKNDRYGIIPYR